MKQRIYNNGKGWYIPCKNRNDDKDKAYMSVYFPKNTEEPVVDLNKGQYTQKDIDILECAFNCYKGKIGMTVFKYVEIKIDENKTHGNANQYIEPNDLPFYY